MADQSNNGLVRALLSRMASVAFKPPNLDDAANFIDLASRYYLGRELSLSERDKYLDAVRRGVPLQQLARDIQEGPEARSRACISNGSNDAIADPRDAIRDLLEVAFQYHLGRSGSTFEIDAYADSLQAGRPFSTVLQDIRGSEEAKAREAALDQDTAFKVNLLYEHYLGRRADAEGLRVHVDALKAGTLLSALAKGFENSEEATNERRSGSNSLSDGDFIVMMADILFEGRGALAEEVERWRAFLGDDREKRLQLLRGTIETRYQAIQASAQATFDTDRCWIMGTDRYISSDDWKTAAKVARDAASTSQPLPHPNISRPFHHTGTYLVSAIASMYRAGAFIERFLENIVSQSIFDRSELIIVDADSPDNEAVIISEFQARYPNIVYKRINYRIGIYDAWNVGVRLARGPYLTNTNMDDLRGPNSFELQVQVLDEHPFVDVVYQDFYYSLDSALSFEEIAAINIRSDLPLVTPHGLLRYNSPHNAPMWRRILHSEVGLFDTTFRSAGDWEFWLRCILAGKTFFKSNTPHVVYFHNPQGLSTQPDTRGLDEGLRILRMHSKKLISSELRMSREALAAKVGVYPDDNSSHYGLSQRALKELGLKFHTDAGI